MRFAVFATLCLIGLGACAQPAPEAPRPAIIDSEALLVLSAQSIDPLIASVEARGYTVTRVERLDQLRDTLIHLRIPANRTIPEAIEEVEALNPGVTAGANHAYRIQSVPSDHDYADAMIGWPAGGCLAQRSIGLIDAGVLENHPALQSGQIVQRSFYGTVRVPATDHGTLMADLLIGDGRLTGAKLYSANVIDPGRATGDVAGVDAILRAANWLRISDVDLVNISLAGPFNKLLNRGLGRAASDGMIFVAAAGNLGPTAPPQYPAAFPFVLAVTAVDRNQAAYRLAVRGDHIDLAAPGVDIMLESSGKLRVLTGTSAAAPYVTASIAADKDLTTARSMQAVLDRLAPTVKDLGPKGIDSVFGVGLITAPESCGR